jgi:hypothetical protein
MAGGLVVAAAAGLLIPSMRGRRRTDEPEHAEMAIVPGGTLAGDASE